MRAPKHLIRPVLAVLLMLATGCGNGGNYQPTDAGSPPKDGGHGSGGRHLTIVGSPLVQVQTGGSADLTVALVQENIGPVSDATVTFTVVGAAADSTLDATSATTDSQGTATVHLTAGTTTTTFQVKVESAGASPVAFGVQIIKLQQLIQIVRTPNVRPDTAMQNATIDTTSGAKVLLKVRITDQFGNAIPDLPVSFGFLSPAQTATLDNGGTPPTTGPAGEAQVTLNTGTTLSDTFTVTARSDSSGTATWSVNISGVVAKACTTDADCPAGQMCDPASNTCQGTPGCDPANGVNCPPGYQCGGNNECTPTFSTGCTTDTDCGTGQVCTNGTCTASTPQCDSSNPCDPGYTCNGGLCQPQGTSFPDVSGGWYTAHTFNIGQAIPVLGSLAGPLRTIDQLFLGQLGLPGWLNSILQNLIQQYIPQWVQTVVHILDVVATMMSVLRARGYMEINQATDPNTGNPLGAWTGTEVWDSFVFYYLDKCNPIPSDPTPACARVDLMVDDSFSAADLGLKVHPFAGTLTPTVFTVNSRDVEIHVAKLIGWLADKLVDLLTPYSNVSDAITNAIDCASLAASVSNACSFCGDITGLCNSAVAAIAKKVTDALYGLAFNLGLLEFDGHATIHVDPSTSDPAWATDLGAADFETGHDGHYDHCKFTKVVGGVPADWFASRDSIP